jgi:ethanolamine kinase
VLPNTGAGSASTNGVDKHDTDITPIQPRRAGSSMWEVLQRWVLALPVATPEQRARRLTLQKELEWVVGQLDDGVGIGEDGVRHPPPADPILGPRSPLVTQHH